MQALRLVTTTPHHTFSARERAVDVAQQVFEHWAYLHREGMPVARRVSEERKRVVWRAVDEFGFGVDVLMLAVEGARASRFCQGANRTGLKLDDLAWILHTEARIERLAEIGQTARNEFEAQASAPQVAAPASAQTEEQRERLARLRKFLASKA